MRFFFLRHTSLNVDQDIFYGQTDLDVSDKFEYELEKIRIKIVNNITNFKNIDIFSSPLMRCKKLAYGISENINFDDRLKELDLGDWEMKPKNQIPKKFIEEWENNIMTFHIPNGESNKDFIKRLKSFIDEKRKLEKDLLIVAHAGSINGMISILTSQPFDKLLKKYWEKIGYGSLSLVEFRDSLYKIKYVGK